MSNVIELKDLTVGDTVAYFCGWGSTLPPQEKKVARTTKLYIILEGHNSDKFRKDDGTIVNFTLGKTERIQIPTTEILAKWDRQKLIEEFTELMNRRKNFEIKALKKALQRLLSEDLTQDELIKISSCVIKCKSLSTQALKEATADLWGGVS
jgi:hypothetical protein